MYKSFLGSLILLLVSSLAFACDVLNIDEYISEAIFTSRIYWIGSIVLYALILLFHFKRTKNIILTILSGVLIVFHPSWWASPLFGPDCSNPKIFLSKVVLVMILCLLLYESIQFVKHIKKIKLNNFQNI